MEDANKLLTDFIKDWEDLKEVRKVLGECVETLNKACKEYDEAISFGQDLLHQVALRVLCESE